MAQNKCNKCNHLATHEVPELLCAKHWAEWFALGENDNLTPEQEKEYLHDIITAMRNTIFVFLNNSLKSTCGKYTIKAETAGYVVESKDDKVIIEFTLMDEKELVFLQCEATAEDYRLDEEHMKQVKESLAEENFES